ncbi:YicC family protein [Flavobacteriaceae bacterium]|uniref:YicC/YloC family endoribonuclease n=1 Tax=Candidatus Arcticimaribacter forsetii TaxID=2820661 RepID=UPI0020779038|nr:YicC/YloC family endoribonuclease [Candidatus Arcticimaribacter forsetii]MDA8699494.1 YicC family protein [Flavobacteriaceae bacterium]MDB2329341.1 YicC family protein [Flavobacteriaceae bacterium]MDB2345678.1 YicC family protein [Flavobacteriaceae bacterium]MDB4620412.1 YicC family protein [Flavobacteriaceae bacterium]MDB4674108.1 YicC family protein [Flavobacteriaceae bacterium]
MITSMTGFGKSETQVLNKKMTVEIRTLNSKNIDLNFRVPHVFRELEPQMRTFLNKQLTRGKIDVSVYVEGNSNQNSNLLNKEVIDNYIAQLKGIHDGDTTELLKMALRLPDTLKTEKEDLKEEEKDALLEVFSSALKNVNEYRRNEGAALGKDFIERLNIINNLLKEVITIDPERKEKISVKLKTALDQLEIDIDQNRMEQELIYYLEKYDITEEKVRLANHLNYFEEIMAQENPNGKKLGFIAQEMGREINTIGSKANHSGLQKIVVQMKDELEKIKEQLLNVL